MISRGKIFVVLAVGTLAVPLDAAPASAQFIAGGGIGNPLGGFPFVNPYFSYNRFAQRSFTFQSPFGGTISATRFYSGSTAGYYHFYNRLPYPMYSMYNGYVAGGSQYGGGMAGGYQRPAANQAMIGAAQQRQAQRYEGEARKQVFDQWAQDKLSVQGLKDPALKDVPPELAKSLAASTEGEVASGESLNNILVATIALEKKGAKGAGVTLPRELLDEITFGGTPSSEALNVLRGAGKLPYPAVFEREQVRPAKDELDRQFSDVAAAASTGKPIDPAKLARLSGTIQKARDRIASSVRNLSAEDALVSRRFLDDLDGVVKVLKKDSAMAGIVKPRWATEGTTVPDLVKHMTKYKLLFGPARKNGGEAYLALHRGLAAYHLALNQQVVARK